MTAPTPAAEPEQLLTVPEVAALTRLTEQNVRSLLEDKGCPLKGVRVGRYIRVLRSSYDAYVASLAAA